MNDFTENFKQLPTEVQKLVLTYDPRLFRPFSQVNRQYQQLLDIDYESMICKQDFRLTEKQNYFRTNPLPIFVMYELMTTNNNAITRFNGKICVKTMNHGYIIHTITVNFSLPDIVNPVQIVTETINDITNPIELKITNDTYFDYLSVYHMLMNRLRCIRLNPRYAIRKNLEYLDGLYHAYSQFGDKPDDNNLLRIAVYFLILYVNSYTFNIYPSPKLELLRDIRNNVATIKQENERLYSSIRRKILAL